MAADDPPHGRITAQTVGVVHVVVPAKASENGLAELPDKNVATVLPTTGVREYVPGNLGQSDRIIQFPLRQQPSVGSDRGTVEHKLRPRVKIQPRNPLFRFTHRVSHINTKSADNIMILIPESGCAVIKLAIHLGNPCLIHSPFIRESVRAITALPYDRSFHARGGARHRAPIGDPGRPRLSREARAEDGP